jgi:hypothetical protein
LVRSWHDAETFGSATVLADIQGIGDMPGGVMPALGTVLPPRRYHTAKTHCGSANDLIMIHVMGP